MSARGGGPLPPRAPEAQLRLRRASCRYCAATPFSERKPAVGVAGRSSFDPEGRLPAANRERGDARILQSHLFVLRDSRSPRPLGGEGLRSGTPGFLRATPPEEKARLWPQPFLSPRAQGAPLLLLVISHRTLTQPPGFTGGETEVQFLCGHAIAPSLQLNRFPRSPRGRPRKPGGLPALRSLGSETPRRLSAPRTQAAGGRARAAGTRRPGLEAPGDRDVTRRRACTRSPRRRRSLFTESGVYQGRSPRRLGPAPGAPRPLEPQHWSLRARDSVLRGIPRVQSRETELQWIGLVSVLDV